MRILILDDNEIIFGAPADYLVDPHDYRNDEVVQVSHPDVFWQVYEEDVWDEIWLDHDLGLSHFTGRDVTKRFNEMAHAGRRFSSTFYVVTMNPSIATIMISDLRVHPQTLAYFVPFGQFGQLGATRGGRIQNRRKVIRRIPDTQKENA